MREFPFVLLSSFLFCPRSGGVVAPRAGSLSTLSGVAPRSRKAESSGWRCDCLSARTSEGERKILVVFQFHRILLSLTLSESEVREGWMDEGVGPVLKWPLR